MLLIIAPLDIFQQKVHAYKMLYRRLFLTLCSTLALSGCSYFGMESQTDIAAKKNADFKALGAGCRFSNRSLEYCYSKNKKAANGSIFEGWKEMDLYMRENKIEGEHPVDQPEPIPKEKDKDYSDE